MKPLEAEWNKFREGAISEHASMAQLTDMRRAFYAGATSLYILSMRKMDGGGTEKTIQQQCDWLERIALELNEFHERVMKGWA
jgi:hypothetical protein